MRLDLLVFAMTAAASTIASAADPAVTIYRSDSDTLFDAGNQPVADGHAIVQRTERHCGLLSCEHRLVITSGHHRICGGSSSRDATWE